MTNKLFQGKNKYFTAFALSITLVFSLGFLHPVLNESAKNNWENNLAEKIVLIEKGINFYLTELFNKIHDDKNKIIEKISALEIDTDEGRIEAFSVFQNNKLYDYSIVLFDEDWKIIAWNNSSEFASQYQNESGYSEGEYHFYETPLNVFLVCSEKIKINNSRFRIVIAVLIEKKYELDTDFFIHTSLHNQFSEQFKTKFQVSFSPSIKSPIDGRYHSFQIKNNLDNDIGSITFQKPLLDTELNTIASNIKVSQALLILIGIIFLSLGLYNYLKKIPFLSVKFFAVFFAVIGYRVLIFVFGIPSEFINYEILNPSYFSSTFGYGIVKSPLEFLITSISLIIVAIYALRYLGHYISNSHTNITRIKLYLISPVFMMIMFVLFRGLGATIKSIVFDSSILYFADFTLVPEFPAFVMNLNVLLFSFSLMTFSVVLATLLFFWTKKLQISSLIYFSSILLLGGIVGILYHILQSEPQMSILLRFLAFVFVVSLGYSVFNYRSYLPLILFLLAFASSFISVTRMNFYNSELERESLKEHALDLTRNKQNWYEYVIRETLLKNDTKTILENSFLKESFNLSPAAFKIWASSPLQRSVVDSKVTIRDSNRVITGEFALNYEFDCFDLPDSVFNKNSDILLEHSTGIFDNIEIIEGTKPFFFNNELAGFITLSISYDPNEIAYSKAPLFLVSNNVFANSAVDFNQLRIFDFLDNQLENSFGNISLSEAEENLILGATFSELNEAWMHLNIGGKDHLIYILKTKLNNNERIVAVALEEKDFSFGLFHFFKVFFIHSIFILLFVICYLVVAGLKSRSFQFSFRSRLLLAFLVISILPLLLMAVYFQNLTEEKNQSAIFYKLNKRAVNIEEYLSKYYTSSSVSSKYLYEKATEDLGIKFALFDDGLLQYASKNEFYDIGLLSNIPNSEAFVELNLMGVNSYLVEEKIENFSTYSIYHRAKNLSPGAIIKVSDVFNPILLPMSSTEVTIFLFGSYSLVVILIVILSTFMANQISLPIRKLTHAAKSVASGDLGLVLSKESKGEVQSLVDEFNFMVSEIKKNQTELAEIERETAWKEMAKQVAHEIKNPLTPMKLSVQQLIAAYKDKHPRFDDIFETVTGTVISQIETLKNIASEFSSFARMPSTKLEKLDLAPVIESAVKLFSDEDISIKIQNEVSNFIIQADEDQFKRSIINIIRNSIQADAKNIFIQLTENDTEYNIKIIDDGKGIAADIALKVFDANFTTKQNGMGLGLSMVKRYIENINGSIILESDIGKGTTIIIGLAK